MRKKQIFIVDDNVMFAEMLYDHLCRYPGFEIKRFGTGEECLNNLHLNPDLIILDYYLNDAYKDAANGLQILHEISNKKSDAQVIMLSSQQKYGVAAQTISQGAKHYVIKDENAFQNIDRILKEIFQ